MRRLARLLLLAAGLWSVAACAWFQWEQWTPLASMDIYCPGPPQAEQAERAAEALRNAGLDVHLASAERWGKTQPFVLFAWRADDGIGVSLDYGYGRRDPEGKQTFEAGVRAVSTVSDAEVEALRDAIAAAIGCEDIWRSDIERIDPDDHVRRGVRLFSEPYRPELRD